MKHRMLKSGTIATMIILIMAVCCIVLHANSAFANSNAEIEATQINVTVSKSGGNAATTASLDRQVYVSGNTVNLTWKGASSGNDFYIPTSVTYGNKKLTASDLISIDTVQSANTEYQRRMKSSGTMTDFDTLKANIVKEHTISLGKFTVSMNVKVEFTKVTPVYRMYNMITSEHLFTTNKSEYDNFVKLGKSNKDAWIGEGISWLSPSNGSTVVHRLYNAGLGALGSSSHYYTANTTEIASLLKQGWTDDGQANQFKSGGSVGIYTCYNEALGSAHHYTSSKTEWQGLKQHGWALEEDKNGKSGVFTGILATSWSYNDVYYVVEHVLDGKVADKQYVARNSETNTAAKAKSYPGYSVAATGEATIEWDNSTIVQIVYKRNSYNVSFNGNGQTVTAQTQTIEYGKTITKPGNQNASGYTFGGWYWDQACKKAFNFSTKMPSGSLTLYAKWTENKQVRYVVLHRYQKTDGQYPELDANGNPEEGIEYEYKYGAIGSTTTEVARKTAGFKRATVFQRTLVENTSTLNPETGWPDLNPDTQLPDNWVDIRYERNKHNLTFNLNGHGSFLNLDIDQGYVVTDNTATIELMQGQEIASIIPSDENWNFAGWYTEVDCDHHWGHGGQGARVMPDNDLTLYAHWTQGQVYDLVYETNGADDAEKFVPYEIVEGTIPQKPSPDPTKVGYTFMGWYEDQDFVTPFNFDTELTSNKTIYAKWEPLKNTKYTVVFKKQSEDGTYDNAVSETITLTGVTGGQTSATALKKYSGYTAVTPIEQKAIQGNGSTVVEVLYARNVHNVMFNSNGHGTEVASQTALYDTLVSQPSREPIANGFNFDGWYRDETCTVQFQFGYDRMPDADLNLYAKWTLSSDFWIGPASRITTGDTSTANPGYRLNELYAGAEQGIVRVESQILDDANVLAAGPSMSGYQEVYDLYKSYMDNDNYHLYVKWNGPTKDSSGIDLAENAYVEFRIIEVGGHSGDGSGLTFQAIHTLPTSYVMNESPTNRWGWTGSNLSSRQLWYAVSTTGQVYNQGNIAKYFEQGFLNAIKQVSKPTSAGETSQSITYNDWSLWVLSYKEVTGESASFVADEGSQYSYYQQMNIQPKSNNSCLFANGLTRALNQPSGMTNVKNTWWLRSPALSNNTSFMAVGGSGSVGGNPSGSIQANTHLGVVLAFCL